MSTQTKEGSAKSANCLGPTTRAFEHRLTFSAAESSAPDRCVPGGAPTDDFADWRVAREIVKGQNLPTVMAGGKPLFCLGWSDGHKTTIGGRDWVVTPAMSTLQSARNLGTFRDVW
jgi:hypothetical protein